MRNAVQGFGKIFTTLQITKGKNNKIKAYPRLICKMKKKS